MVTYNHAAFIGQAIESVLRQERDFALELVIGEDRSTDNTRAIIEDYQSRHPGIIRLITSPNNVGAQPNFIRTYGACEGEYIAMLEGDDYWVDDQKLKLQVELLDQNPDLVMCFAGCSVVNEKGELQQENYVPETSRRRLTQNDIIGSYCPPTLTVLFRNRMLETLPPAFAQVHNGDYFLYSMLTSKGDAAYLPRVVAHYRKHGGGIWTAQNLEKQYRGNLRTNLAVLDFLGGKCPPKLLTALNWFYTQLCTILWTQNRRDEFWPLYREFARFSLAHLNKEFAAYTFRLLTGRLPEVK
ncbi:glycosyltransferase [Hymenobacter chitinivorans]|nr:glycosyltransferase [Hymenobacter chitinivorans]